MKDFYGKDTATLKNKKLFLFDMDGTIYLENKLFDGIIRLMDKIVENGGRYVFITNNSSKSVKDYVKKVKRLGIASATEDNFITSLQSAVEIMKEKYGDQLIYCQGTRSFVKALKKSGLNVTDRYDDRSKVVLVGFDNELTMKKLRNTCETLAKNNPDYYATNPDWSCNSGFGYVPDCGSMCFGIEKATGRKPVFIGKPQPVMIYTAMQKFGCTKEETVVVGDRIYTDIASGYNAGVETVLVLCGESTEKDIKESNIKPTFVVSDVKEINNIFE